MKLKYSEIPWTARNLAAALFLSGVELSYLEKLPHDLMFKIAEIAGLTARELEAALPWLKDWGLELEARRESALAHRAAQYEAEFGDQIIPF